MLFKSLLLFRGADHIEPELPFFPCRQLLQLPSNHGMQFLLIKLRMHKNHHKIIIREAVLKGFGYKLSYFEARHRDLLGLLSRWLGKEYFGFEQEKGEGKG